MNLERDRNYLETRRRELFHETVAAANYASQHSGIHYGGSFETVDLMLEDEEASKRLEGTLERAECVLEDLKGKVKSLKVRLEEYEQVNGTKHPEYQRTQQELNMAEEVTGLAENEIQHVTEMRENPPEQEADQEYVQEKESAVKGLAEQMDYTPTRWEQ